MPQEFIKCVDSLIKSGKSKDSAYAICTAQYKKRHEGRTPQQDEKASLEEIEAMGKFYEEVDAARKSRKNNTLEDMHQMIKKYMKGKE